MLTHIALIDLLWLIQYSCNAIYVTLSVWGLIHFNPRRLYIGEQDGPRLLLLAIWLGFLGGTIHSIASVLSVPLVVYAGFGDAAGVISVIGDIISKGLLCLSAYLYFYARWVSLPENDRPFWTPLLVGFYPDTDRLIYKTIRGLTSRLSAKK